MGELCSPGVWSELQLTLTVLASRRGAVPHPQPGQRRLVLPHPPIPAHRPQPQVKPEVQLSHPSQKDVFLAPPTSCGNRGTWRRGDSGLPSFYQLGQGSLTGRSPKPGPEKKLKQKPLCNALPACTSSPGRGVCDTAQLPVPTSFLLHKTRSWEGRFP